MNKLVSNYLFTVVYQLLLMITPFITTPYISRVLQAEGVGIDAYVMSVVQLFLVFSILSIPIYGSRQIAIKLNSKDETNEFWSIFLIQITISILTCIIYLIFVSSITEYKLLYYIQLFSLFAASIDISWYFFGKEQIKGITIRNILVRIVSIILIFTFVKNSNDVGVYILINSLTLFVGQLIMWIPLLKEIKFSGFSFSNSKEHILPIATLFIPQIMIQVYVLINKIVLGNIAGETEVGYYNQANKIVKIALGIITALGTVLLPRIASEFAKGNREMVKNYTEHTLQFILLITLPMVLGLIAIAPNFVTWFLGDEFLPVTDLLKIMSPVILFVGLANVFGIQVLIATNQQNKYTIAVTVGAILSLLTNLLLVFSLGSIATTLALLVAEAIGALIQMYFARKYLNVKYFLKLFIRYLLLSVCVFIVATIIGDFINISPIIITIIQIVLGATVYVLGLIIIKDSIILKILFFIKSKYKKRG